ncbi:extracellular solute-binding protein [Aeromicrobium sp. 636]|uniref:Extracellular solute-binding protein n=1 Tax=Aeromicrobium senzhongii TaxID=2663859 RepID=A0A8I0EST6_9ACTN|nr:MULTISPECIES: extracellular solute-binding protein [Aeromicrobium]MBC9224773.1 extracellular solute-binding protein [Aeromicrobium senzhongii]MCQ3996886.1 extracellular solute-binding protein [Aeromicrobium sp. 636]MTB86819.1 extracellular solute-binding protein [Aeromicrobium senzhongii]QNL93342.1 extracellular solute-binding protein [Aeromicrobium senzhongii]
MNRTRQFAATLATAIALGGLAACGGSGSSDDGDDITLRVNLFGKFGYTEAYKKFEADHPGVKIVETAEGDLGKYNTKLTQQIAAGGDAGDVVAIEEGQTVAFLAAANKFVNLQDEGGNDVKDRWLPWVWDKATSADGKTTIGYGTDVGGLAMCYRRDLFEKAGLPTDRAEVAQLWPTWDAYIATGKKFQKGIGNQKVAFVDSSTNTYNSILMQEGDHTYFDRDDKLVFDENPAIKTAWDYSVEMTEADLSAQLKAFSDEWNAGFKNGSFATVACPAWMTGYIKDQSGEANAGKWDIATVPGGGGNWGGSWLAVPQTSKHQEMALELIDYLSDEEGQMLAFEAEGRLPSLPALYEKTELKEATNPYFNEAPIGQLFAAGAAALEPVYLGTKNVPVRDAVENALRSVENGEVPPAQGWDDASAAATKAGR